MHITFVSSHPPRKCGIASYTSDLSTSLREKGVQVANVAMENKKVHNTYTKEVSHIIHQEDFSDYEKTAHALNISTTDFVHVQHEYGLFGSEDGEYILSFVRLLKKPVVVTFHTVLKDPTPKQKYIIQELSRLCHSIIVMEFIAQDRLSSIYGINPQRIQVIFHGVPKISSLSTQKAKEKHNLKNKFVILASNLVSRNKGFEYAIEAIAKVQEQIPTIIFLIIGETHPLIKVQEGEAYREELQKIIQKYKLETKVTLINKYLSLHELRDYFAAADICITPYLDPQQITSGTLSYALGMGKACISTAYMYAQHMLGKDRGVLVPFTNSSAIADAIVKLYTKPGMRKKMEEKAKKLGKQMQWAKVAQNHYELYKSLEKRHMHIDLTVKKSLAMPQNLSHFITLTDQAGILQHAHYIIPERRFGYSTDDNARAFIIASFQYAENPKDEYLQYMKSYLTFLRLAQEQNGRFHTFLNFQREWIDSEEVADPYGKAIWALGYHLYACQNSPFLLSVEEMFRISMQHVQVIRDIRTAAYTLLGLWYYELGFSGKKDTAIEATNAIKRLADFLLDKYNNNREENWEWLEDSITYDNFRIPQAFFAAYLSTKENKYKEAGITILNFLMKHNFDFEKNYFDFIGQNGWFQKHKQPARYDQQPLEAAAATDAFLFAYLVERKKSYLDKALIAFSWFFGRNRNKASLLDEKTGGIFDGLTPTGVNLNEGSESLICFLISHYHLQKALKKSKNR